MTAWVEDRWHITVRNPDGSRKKEKSPRFEQGLRWRVRWKDPDGRERAKSFARRPDADAYRSGVEADMRRGTYLDADAGKMSLRKYAEQWLAAQTFDDTTRQTVTGRVRHINDGLGGKTLMQLAASPSAIQAWAGGLKLAPSTSRGCLSILSMICGAAVDDGRMARNPCVRVRPPTQPGRKVVPLEVEDLVALRAALPGQWRAMIDAGACCGMRQGEIFGLAVDDIDFLRRAVHVRRQLKIVGGVPVLAHLKGGKTRDIPLPEEAGLAFSAHVGEYGPQEIALPWHEPRTRHHGKTVKVRLMFTSARDHRPLLRTVFNHRVWRPALEKAGIAVERENGMHVLRHSYASRLLRQGVDVKQVSESLGHSSAAFTLSVYAHLMKGGDDRVREAANLRLTGRPADSADRGQHEAR